MKVRLLSLAALLLTESAFADVSVATEARWLAGVEAVAPFDATGPWAGYAQREDERWRQAAPRIRAIEDWSARNLANVVPPSATVFYPFGGPDALHALALFPGASRIVLVGLEPALPLPDVSHENASD